MITAPDNPRITEVRKLAGRKWRDKLRRFVAEGEDLVAAAAQAGWEPVDLLKAARTEGEGEEVEPNLLAKVSALGSGSRVLGVYEQRWVREPATPCVALFGVADPGNVGTVLRSALAFGAKSVAIGAGTADPYGPKAVRASMGAIFSVPVFRLREPNDLPRPRIALDAHAGEELAAVVAALAPAAVRGRAATLLVGAEREGLPAAAKHVADLTARIPIHQAESLNAAMAATVALYELTRSS